MKYNDTTKAIKSDQTPVSLPNNGGKNYGGSTNLGKIKLTNNFKSKSNHEETDTLIILNCHNVAKEDPF